MAAMILYDWLKKWNLTSLKINTVFLEAEFVLNEADKNAAWDLYVEMITRVITQKVPEDLGDEAAALESVVSIFGLTRSVMKSYGRDCIQFAKIAVVVLNQVVRPFTTKWHKLAVLNKLNDEDFKKEFRVELYGLQNKLLSYTKMLAEMAEVEDITCIEQF